MIALLQRMSAVMGFLWTAEHFSQPGFTAQITGIDLRNGAGAACNIAGSGFSFAKPLKTCWLRQIATATAYHRTGSKAAVTGEDIFRWILPLQFGGRTSRPVLWGSDSATPTISSQCNRWKESGPGNNLVQHLTPSVVAASATRCGCGRLNVLSLARVPPTGNSWGGSRITDAGIGGAVCLRLTPPTTWMLQLMNLVGC
ncbi:MAG: hypothetical protein R2727_03250 [Bacteroidales bacterium]